MSGKELCPPVQMKFCSDIFQYGLFGWIHLYINKRISGQRGHWTAIWIYGYLDKGISGQKGIWTKGVMDNQEIRTS